MILISLSDLIWIFSCVPQRFVVILLRAVTSLFDQNLFHIYWIFYWKCAHWFFRIVYWMMFLICDEILIEMIFYDTWKMLLKDSWRHFIDSTKNGWLLDLSCILFEILRIFLMEFDGDSCEFFKFLDGFEWNHFVETNCQRLSTSVLRCFNGATWNKMAILLNKTFLGILDEDVEMKLAATYQTWACRKR